MSKSPAQQNKLMTNTNYGKFKAIPTTQGGQMGINTAYGRGGGNG